jgi:hypothetical protein
MSIKLSEIEYETADDLLKNICHLNHLDQLTLTQNIHTYIQNETNSFINYLDSLSPTEIIKSEMNSIILTEFLFRSIINKSPLSEAIRNKAESIIEHLYTTTETDGIGEFFDSIEYFAADRHLSVVAIKYFLLTLQKGGRGHQEALLTDIFFENKSIFKTKEKRALVIQYFNDSDFSENKIYQLMMFLKNCKLQEQEQLNWIKDIYKISNGVQKKSVLDTFIYHSTLCQKTTDWLVKQYIFDWSTYKNQRGSKELYLTEGIFPSLLTRQNLSINTYLLMLKYYTAHQSSEKVDLIIEKITQTTEYAEQMKKNNLQFTKLTNKENTVITKKIIEQLLENNKQNSIG